MRVEQAIKMIENHGHKAFVTAEGLACVSECVAPWYTKGVVAVDDCVFEEVTTIEVFTTDIVAPYAIHVDANDVRNWLGY